MYWILLSLKVTAGCWLPWDPWQCRSDFWKMFYQRTKDSRVTMLGYSISGYVFSAVLVLLAFGWLDYIGVKTAVPDLRHLLMLCFFSAESQFRIFQKTPSFLMGPHAPGGTIKLQGIWSPFLKVMTYAQLQSYSYHLFEQICVHTCFERHSEVCFDFNFLLWLSMHLWFLSILTFSIFQYTSVCPFSWWYLLEITNPGKQMRWMEI